MPDSRKRGGIHKGRKVGRQHVGPVLLREPEREILEFGFPGVYKRGVGGHMRKKRCKEKELRTVTLGGVSAL